MRSVAVGLCAVAAFLLLCGGATAATWSAARLPGPAGKVYLLGVSCPTTTFCVAAGTNNLIASTTDPAAGVWNFVYAGDGPWPETDNWPTEAISGKQIQAISCPSTGLCVGVTDKGYIYSSTNPTGPASAWAVTEISGAGPNTHLEGVSCPTTGLCVAVSGGRIGGGGGTSHSGEILTSTNPTAGVWQIAELGEQFDLRGVSCASVSLCVAVGYHGEILSSTNPTGGAATWTDLGAPAGPGSLGEITCRPGLCITGNTGGNILTSTAPGAASWSATPGGASVQITGTACASVSECVVVDNNGDVITSTAANSANPAWSRANLLPYTPAEGNALFGASCPQSTFCALAGSHGQILTSTDPFAAPPPPSPPAGGATRKHRQRAHGPKRPRTRIARIHLAYPKPGEAPRVEVLVRFYAHGRVRGYQCRLDQGRFLPCRSPKRYWVGRGHHYVRVRAIGTTGKRGRAAIEDFWIGRHRGGPHGTGPILGDPFPPKGNGP